MVSIYPVLSFSRYGSPHACDRSPWIHIARSVAFAFALGARLHPGRFDSSVQAQAQVTEFSSCYLSL